MNDENELIINTTDGNEIITNTIIYNGMVYIKEAKQHLYDDYKMTDEDFEESSNYFGE